VQELLNIEQFGQTKFNKIKTKYFREFGKLESIKVKNLFLENRNSKVLGKLNSM
jgi:hypothetical protein